MIKKIPINGISRDPSGQVSADGFCVESLNVQLDMGEVAPVIKPVPVKNATGTAVSVQGDILFIHKGIGYENLICKVGNNLAYVATIPAGAGTAVTFHESLANGEVINDIKSVGNTLAVSTSADMYYFLWKNGEYNFLGHQIPVPQLHFRMGDLEQPRTEPVIPENATADDFDDIDTFDRDGVYDDGEYTNIPPFKHDTAGDITEFGKEGSRFVLDASLYDGFWTDYLEFVWWMLDRHVNSENEEGRALYPVFVRYAVRLYDGTMYAQSIPVLVGADIAKFFAMQCILDEDGISGLNMSVHITNMAVYAKGYSILMDAGDVSGLFDGWEDIVTGVDIFVSPQIRPIQRNAAHVKVEYESENQSNRLFDLELSVDPYYSTLRQDQLITYYQQTYLAKRFTLSEFTALDGETKLDINFNSDYIMAQEALRESPRSMHHYTAGRLFTYNKRLLLQGAEMTLDHGYPFLHSVKWDSPSANPTKIRLVYYIQGDGGEAVVVSRDVSGETEITPSKVEFVADSGTLYEEVPISWLAYPDSRCYRVEIHFVSEGTDTLYSSYPMKPMDSIDVAYVFFGFGIPIIPVSGIADGVPEEHTSLKMPSTLMVSKANNPFVFPVDDSVTFTAGEILNIAVATKALSEGQFGQFPLYVFTDEGVFAMSVGSQGEFQANHPVSRDVLISREAIAGIEQGVFFAAARGLLLLQGSAVTRVSSVMEGFPYAVDQITAKMIKDSQNIEIPAMQKFFRFLDGCKLVYDYVNTRIVLFKESETAQYVYKFDTRSWHRMSAGIGAFVRALNSYPEAQVVTEKDGTQSVYNLSVPAESEDAVAVPGVVYTRDLALDAADIYKTIFRIRVRGRYGKGHVKWQLQGSNDGIRYRNLHSLRGPSWKWYRIVLALKLDKDERVSFIEMDYAPRFTNKVR